MKGDIETGNAPQSYAPVGFSDKTIRLGFIRKVYSILSVQLLITTCFITLAISVDSFNEYVRSEKGYSLYIASVFLTLVFIVILACCSNTARTYPQNYIFLFLFTICQSFMLAVVSARFETSSVAIAGGFTIAVFFGLTIYAWKTKRDFTTSGGLLLSLLIILIVWGLFSMIFRSQLMSTVYAAFGALLFSAYIVYDTQLIIGGAHKKFQFGVDDYVFAALNLYLDIVNLFLIILSFGERR